MQELKIIPWPNDEPVSDTAIRNKLKNEGFNYYPWSNGPGDIYSPHKHSYNKVIYVARGAITFHLPESKKTLTLQTGDRLELPAHTVHSAAVGPQGVMCYEAHL